MTDNRINIKISARDTHTRLKLDDIIRSTEGFRIHRSSDDRKPDLLIFELGEDAEKDFQLIESLINSGAAGEVFLTAEKTSQRLLLRAIRTGAKEFFSHPLKEQEVREALEKFKGRREEPSQREPLKSGQIIGVIGSKGGIGTTTVAVNLAVSLAEKRSDQSIALVDANILFGEIPLFLDIQPSYHWGEIAKDISRLDSTFIMSILTKHSSGIHVLPSPSYLNGSQGATPETIGRLLGLMQRMFDFVVIDGGQPLNEVSLKILEMSDKVLLISLLSLPCLSNMRKILKSFANSGCLPKERINVVINRYLRSSEVSLSDAERSLDKKIFWTIPNDYKRTASAINQGKTLSQIASKAPTTKSLRGLADILTQGEKKKEKKR